MTGVMIVGMTATTDTANPWKLRFYFNS